MFHRTNECGPVNYEQLVVKYVNCKLSSHLSKYSAHIIFYDFITCHQFPTHHMCISHVPRYLINLSSTTHKLCWYIHNSYVQNVINVYVGDTLIYVPLDQAQWDSNTTFIALISLNLVCLDHKIHQAIYVLHEPLFSPLAVKYKIFKMLK